MISFLRTCKKVQFGIATMQSRQAHIKAAIFDMGGVLMDSPGKIFADFESRAGAPKGTLLKTINASTDDSAWFKMERGELDPVSFGKKFSLECLKETGVQLDAKDLLSEMVKFCSNSKPFPIMVKAITNLRKHGLKTALLTNNFFLTNNETYQPFGHDLFDVIIESARVGMRKPEPRIYEKVLNDLQVLPSEAVFLDDLGQNLKTAKNIGIFTIKVESPEQAIKDLESLISFKLIDYEENLKDVPDRLNLDVNKLQEYFKTNLNLHSNEKPTLKYFQHGQSNPTYLVNYMGKSMVLRKKPPGFLLPTAHSIEREFKIMEVLKSSDVPVPKMISFCSDDSILGTPFYLMEYVEGVVFKDPMLPGLSDIQKKNVFEGLCTVLNKIHAINFKELGLENFGGKGSFVERNLKRWWKQYESSKDETSLNGMCSMYQWLVEHLPCNEKVALVHGDYRLDNLIFDPVTCQPLAVIDWELSTLGDPLVDVANCCSMYLFPRSSSFLTIDMKSREAEDIPNMDDFLKFYFNLNSQGNIPENWDFYVVFLHFRVASILQGVYKRFLNNQSSSLNANLMLTLAQKISENGWNIAQNSKLYPKEKNSFPSTNLAKIQPQFGLMVTCMDALDQRAHSTVIGVRKFIEKHVIPFEKDLFLWHSNADTKWTIHPRVEELKEHAKSEGLWNLFVPREIDLEASYGKGFSNVEYSFMAEEMGKSPLAAEIFNCSAPDTGNMEVLIRYGSKEQKDKWLMPLLDGKIRSCFAMTEPGVACSDATNVQASIRKDKNEFIINGHKWWTSGALDPRCSFSIFMGKTNESGNPHHQQTMLIVPMDSPGVKIIRPLLVYGFDDAPHGHAEILFENVRVPETNLLLGEGRGFEIAQGRLGPGRIHHCMRILGGLERCLEEMLKRTQQRVAFGKPLIEHGTIQYDIAKARIQIEQARLLVLKAAHVMDMSGNKAAALEIAMIKSVVPEIGCEIINRTIQSFGGMGVCQDVILSQLYAIARSLCIADGPTEVHLRSVAKMEIKKFNSRI